MADECRHVEVDGEIISVRGSEPMTGKDLEMFAQVIRAAKAKFAAERLAAEQIVDLAAQSAHYAANPRVDDAGDGTE